MPVRRVALLTAGGYAPCLSSAVGALIERYTDLAPEVEIIAYRHGDRSFFVYGFAKNEMDNIADDDLKDVTSYAAALMTLTDELIAAAQKAKKIEEVICDA